MDNLHFRLEKEAKFGHDNETGEPCCAYVKVGVDANIPDENRMKVSDELKKIISEVHNINSDYITPITEEEYKRNTD